jgi:predicted dehydrogenase
LGAHLIDQALQLVGLPNSVEAELAIRRVGTQANDHFEVDLQYTGFRVRLGSNMLQEPDRFSYTLSGSGGVLQVARSDQQEAALLAGALPSLSNWCVPDPGPSATFTSADQSALGTESFILPSGNYMDYYSGIYAAIRSGGNNPVPPIESLRVMELIDAAFQSHSAKGSIPADAIFHYSA